MTTAFQGWGRTRPSLAFSATPRSVAELSSIISSAGGRGAIVRGLGRSYGDAAQNAGGTVIDLTGWQRILDLDQTTATVTVESGISLDTLMRALLPHGLWLPVIPGTRQVTVGGAIAADVHGKNHHVSGSFGNHILEMDLLLASGDVLTLTPNGPQAGLFWATIGGMGLTGIVTQATIALKKVESSYFLVDTERVRNLDQLLTTLTDRDDRYEYSVAWFDTATTGDNLGRAVVTRGNSARLADLSPAEQSSARNLAAKQFGTVPFTLPNGLVNRVSARAFNSLWFAKAPARRDREVQDITQFFHPLDLVGDWNKVYGSKGLCQYQFVVPFGAEDVFAESVRRIAESPHVSSLNVLKRFGPGNRSPLSFPIAGWALAIDLPVRRGLQPLLNELDELVISAYGRVYLAKDSRTSARAIHTMYPRLDEFASIRATVDPSGRFQSDLSRRLDL
ncbi:MAG: FAD-binding oxidoreductase [Aeromicrobium sp.]